MKVVCLYNRVSALPDKDARDALASGYTTPGPDIDVGREYLVYGIALVAGRPWYFIDGPTAELFPYAVAAEFFRVSDPNLPAHWGFAFWGPAKPTLIERILGFASRRVHEHVPVGIISFREWIEDASFFERLVDGDAEARRAYEAEKTRLHADM